MINIATSDVGDSITEVKRCKNQGEYHHFSHYDYFESVRDKLKNNKL